MIVRLRNYRGFLIAVLLCAWIVPGKTQTGMNEVNNQWTTLEELVAEAERQNPELRAVAYELESLRLKVPPAGALPDPVVSIGQMSTGNIAPFAGLGGDEMSRVSIGIEQEFPLFGKRDVRRKIAAKEADIEARNYESVRLRIVSELKITYYEWFYQFRVLETLHKNMALLESFEETATSQYRVGNATQADVLRAQTEQTRLQEQIELAEQSKAAAEAKMKSLLNRPAESELPPPAPLEKSVLRFQWEELRNLALERFPMLLQQEEMIQARQYALELAEKERKPDAGMMFAYHNRGGLKDIWEIAGTIRIPLYFNRKQKYEIDSAGARVSAAKEQLESLRSSVQFELKDAYLEATTSERLMRLFEETIVPQDTLTLEATTASYRVGRADALSMITSLMQLSNDEIRYYEYLTRFQKALARMEPLVGEELTR